MTACEFAVFLLCVMVSSAVVAWFAYPRIMR